MAAKSNSWLSERRMREFERKRCENKEREGGRGADRKKDYKREAPFMCTIDNIDYVCIYSLLETSQ